MSDQTMSYLDSLAAELEVLKQNQANMPQYPTSTMFGGQPKQNLVEWQLDFKPELEDIEHLLRNDVLKRDERGNEYWARNPNPDEIIFNERGVNELLKIIRMYLNKNTVLSNYQKEDIALRMRQFGHELRAEIYNNYSAYGLDTDYKRNHYPMIVISIIAMVESAYRRALNGEERRDLNSARSVIQNDSPQPQMMGYPPMVMPQKRGLSKLLPWNWGK